MASSFSSIFLLATITLAFLCHNGASSAVDAKTAAKNALSAIKGASDAAKKQMHGSTKEPAQACIDNFDDATEQINKCLETLKSFKKESLSDLQTWASGALTGVTTCNDEFPSQPADMQQASTKAHDSVVSFLKIVNAL